MYKGGRIEKPRREKGIMAWIKRWFCCGIRRENEVMKIYLGINQLDDNEIWNSDI
jgi:hypothetical protein